MPQKFILIAVTGYVLFASLAAVISTGTYALSGTYRRLTIILLHWSAALVFVLASLPTMLRTASPLSIDALWPVPMGVAIAAACGAALTALYNRPALTGWWSPLPWLRGVVVATAATAWASASQGAGSTFLPDWRFVGASLVLWGVCLILADIALFASRSATDTEPSSQVVRELLRLCAALPALLIYLIGIRI